MSANTLQLVIPKHHGAKLTDIPDDQLNEILPVVKKIAAASGAENWNILQNNGRLAHQVVDHVSLAICRSAIVERDELLQELDQLIRHRSIST
jgi:hypothetical protein